jgi:hypothetical protein
MENKQKCVLIVGMVLVSVLGVFFLLLNCVERRFYGYDNTVVSVQVPVGAQAETHQIEIVAHSTPVLEWEMYVDKQYSFEFKYPKGYAVESRDDSFQREIVIRDNSNGSIAVNVTKWKDLTIEEGTPGTFWMKLGYGGWEYFVDNFDSIKTGKCDEEAAISADPMASEKSSMCLITKAPGYIKIETENKMVFHTKDIEIRWELGAEGDKSLMNEMASSFKFSK